MLRAMILSFNSKELTAGSPEGFPLSYLTAVLLNFMKHLIEVFIELFKLKHCGGIPLLEI